MNIPNLLTSLRIFLIPILVIVYFLPWEGRFYASAAIFGIAAITDWLDGFLARALNQSTPFGAFFDPVADKVMVSVALVILVAEYNSVLMTLASAVIVGREIVISALREWMAEMGKRASVAVSFVGKVKTTMQMMAIFVLLSLSNTSNTLPTNTPAFNFRRSYVYFLLRFSRTVSPTEV